MGYIETVFSLRGTSQYLGYDGIIPFIENSKKYGAGIFILVRTSNPSAHDLQDVKSGSKKIYEIIGHLVNQWGEGTSGKRHYKSIGAVVGATYSEEAAKLRVIMPNSFFLVPGYGIQGATADDIIPCFNSDGLGAIINSSRGIIFAYQDPLWKQEHGELSFEIAIEAAVVKMKEEINKVRFIKSP